MLMKKATFLELRKVGNAKESNAIFEKASNTINQPIVPNIKATNINQTKAPVINQVLNKIQKFNIDVHRILVS